MSKIYVKHVSSNVKCGVDAALGQRTLIVGPNGSGKSAIINSVELALGGFASDVVGRSEMAREIDLMQLAKNGADALFSVAKLSDGQTATYEAGGEKKKARRKVPGYVDSTFAFPLRAVREALLGSAATTRKFFLSYASSGITDEEVALALSPDFRKMYLDTLPTVPGQFASDKLLGVLEFARKRGNDEASAAKMTKAAVSTVSRDLPPEPSEAEIAMARARVAEAQKNADDAVRAEVRQQQQEEAHEAAKRRLAVAERRMEGLLPREAVLVERLAATQEAAEAAHDKIPHFPIQSALDVLDHQPVGDPCLFCGGETTVQSVLDSQEVLKSALADAAAAQAAINAHRAEVAACEAFMREVDAAQKEIDAAKTALTRFEGMTHSEIPDVAALGKVRQDAHAHLNALLQAKAAWDSATKVIDAAVDADSTSVEWKKLALVLEKLVLHFLDKGVHAFEERVQEFLPEDDKFALRLRDGDREVCQFGFVRDGHLHTALSGSEWLRINTALAGACRYGDVNIIIPEDRGWDAQTLIAAMEAFGKIDCQVIIATTITAIEKYHNWNIIRTPKQ